VPKRKTKILILGTGFGGIHTFLSLHKFFRNENSVEISLIGENDYFLFTPLLHEAATGGINPESIMEPIADIFGHHPMYRFIKGKIKKINTIKKTVEMEDFSIEEPFDFLIIALGAETNFYDIKGAEKYSLVLKNTDHAQKIKEKIKNQNLSCIVVGGGPTGVELSVEIREYAGEKSSITLIHSGKEILPAFHPKIREKSLQILQKDGIHTMLGKKVVEIGENFVLLDDGEKIMADIIIWTAGVKAREIKFDREIKKSPNDRIQVDEFLRLPGEKNIFALGDNTLFLKDGNPLPPLAQVAEQQAKITAKNIFLSVKEKDLKPFDYKHKGNMLSLGRWRAMGEIKGFVFDGKIAWFLWRTLYLSKMITLKKKISIALDWTIHLLSERR
jgi:NADH dehydrogenase